MHVGQRLLLEAEQRGQLLVEQLVLVVEEVFPELHEVGGLLEAEVELLGHQQEIVVVDDVLGLFVECAEEDGADGDDTAVLSGAESTVGSLIQVLEA